MSGNYDFPPASDSTPRRSASDRPQENPQSRLQNLRNLILFSTEYTSDTARALETLNNEIEQLRSDSTRRRTAYQTRAVMNRQSQHQQAPAEASDRSAGNPRQSGQNQEQGRFPVNTSSSSNTTSQVSLSPYDETGRWVRPSETIERLRGNRRDSNSGSLADLERAAARLREANATIASVLQSGSYPTARQLNTGSPDLASWASWPYSLDTMLRQPDPSSSPGSRWRSKRRKLDSDDDRDGLTGFSYGHYGQVVPGRLKMEISSCDGGSYYDEGQSSWPGNVLLDDSSVYCTKKSRCNMILNHHGETPFSLKKIIIRAPKKGFDAAIQEGMVFVSMSSDELLERTAQYQIHYPPRSQRCHDSRRHYSNPSREYMNAYRVRNQGTASTGDSDAQAEPRNQSGNSNGTPWSRRSLTIPTYAEPQFRVTTDYDTNPDETTNDEQENTEFVLPPVPEFPLELRHLLDEDDEVSCPEDEEDGDNGDDGNTVEFNRGRMDTRRQTTGHGRSHYGVGSSHRLNSPSLIEPVWPSSGAGNPGGDSNRQPEVMKPHARFFIEQEKSMVSIKFDPPVSGRFVLIKLWSPYSGGNIDIESIMVYGFAGTRYFPALDVR